MFICLYQSKQIETDFVSLLLFFMRTSDILRACIWFVCLQCNV